MANSLSITKQTVFGDCVVQFATLDCADGAAGLPVATGLNYVDFCAVSSSQATRATCNGTTNGNVLICTAASGCSAQLMIVGH